MTHITCRQTAKNRDQLRTLRLVIEYGLPFFKRCHDPNDHVSGVFISVFEANEHVQAYHEICGVWSVRRQTYGYLPSRIDFIFVSDIVKKLGWPE